MTKEEEQRIKAIEERLAVLERQIAEHIAVAKKEGELRRLERMYWALSHETERI